MLTFLDAMWPDLACGADGQWSGPSWYSLPKGSRSMSKLTSDANWGAKNTNEEGTSFNESACEVSIWKFRITTAICEVGSPSFERARDIFARLRV